MHPLNSRDNLESELLEISLKLAYNCRRY